MLAEAFTNAYTDGRKAFAKKPTTENLHDWRKRVKDLWYQQRLLEETWPGVMKAQAKEAKKLSKLLGEDHDLAVLAETLRTDPELTRFADEFEPVIAKRRKKLLKQAAQARQARLRREAEGVREALRPLSGSRHKWRSSASGCWRRSRTASGRATASSRATSRSTLREPRSGCGARATSSR